MPRYSISNAPTEIAVCQLDPAEIGGDWRIYISGYIYLYPGIACVLSNLYVGIWRVYRYNRLADD